MDRKQLMAQLMQEQELIKMAQEVEEGDMSQGQEIAEKVFEKFLNELDLTSID
jgi:hypothetical protein